MTVLDAVAGPADLRGLDATALARLAARAPRDDRGVGRGERRAPRLEPRRGGAHARAAPRLRLPTRPDRLGHRSPGLRPQARDRPPRGIRPAPPGGRRSRATRRAASRSTTSSRTRHASTSLSYAYGLAVGRDAGGADRHVVARHRRRRAHRRDGVRGAEQPRLQRSARDRRRERQRPVVRAHRVAPRRAGATGDAARFFAALGFDYRGPVDGHDIAALEAALRAPRASTRVRPSCTCSRARVGATRRRRTTTRSACTTSPRSTPGRASRDRPARSRTRTRSPKRCSGSPTGTPNSWRSRRRCRAPPACSPSPARHPDRCFDVGIAEQHAVTAAAGMAMRGLRPVVAIYSTFLNRAWDQVLHDVGLHGLPVVFCVDRAGITGDDGPSHHGVYDLALLTKVPGMTVFAPSSYAEVGVMLRESLRITSGPVALRWPKTPARRGRRGRDRDARAAGARGARRVHPRGREDGRGGAGGGRDPRRRRHPPDDLGRALGTARRAHAHGRGPLPARRHRRGRHRRRRRRVADRGALGATAGDRGPRVVVLGTPLAYLPHGKLPDLLAQLGLDGAGIAAAAVKALRDLERAGRAGRADRPD